jgi:hypothetical protein
MNSTHLPPAEFPDLTGRADIERLVNAFYGKVRQDDLLLSRCVDAINANRPGLHDVEPFRRTTLVEKMFSFIELLGDDEGDDLVQFLLRNTAEKLAGAESVAESDRANGTEILRHGEALSRFFVTAPEIGYPTAVGLRFGARGETFAPEFLDKRRRQKGRNQCEAFSLFEGIHTPANSGEWFDPLAKQLADIESFE